MITDLDLKNMIYHVENFGTDEQLKNTYKDVDFTLMPPTYNPEKSSLESNKMFCDIKNDILKTWISVLKRTTGVKSSKNYSDSHPVKALENCACEHFAGLVMKEINTPGGIEAAKQMIDDVTVPVIGAVLADYVISKNMSVFNLTKEEVQFQIDRVNNFFMEMLIQNLQTAQGVPEIIDIVKSNGAHEDFDNLVVDNHDKIDFYRKWEHSRTKIGSMLSFEKLNPDDNSFAIEDTYEVTANDEQELLDVFMQTLDSAEQEIVKMCLKKYTQAEIAKALGYKTQGAVSKKMAKIKDKWNTLFETEI